MHISELVFENIRGYSSKTQISLVDGINYFVGENNSGKSSILDAIMYLKSGPSNMGEIYTRNTDGSYVEATLVFSEGELEQWLTAAEIKRFKPYFEQQDQSTFLHIRRQSYERQVTNSATGRVTKVTEKNILLQNPAANPNSFENPSGIDASLKKLLDLCFVYADELPSEYTDMGKTKTLGRLISQKLTEIETTDRWTEYQSAHKALFQTNDEGSVQSKLEDLANSVAKLMEDQYGTTSIHFTFDPPDPQSLFKNGRVLLSESTSPSDAISLESKGTGMQRAFMLALIQVVAQQSSSLSSVSNVVFGFDEPETWMHPRAQIQLASALAKLASTRQVLMLTHSPYMLSGVSDIDEERSRVFIASHPHGAHTIRKAEEFGRGILDSISLNAINYFAFQVPTPEFMDELYGTFQDVSFGYGHSAKEKQIIERLEKFGCTTKKTWKRNDSNRNQYDVQISVYIRNYIHHPENKQNAMYTISELEDAIKELLMAIKKARQLLQRP